MNLVTLCVEKLNCVDDYYSTSADFICRKCLYKCKSCVGEEECVSCAQNYYFYNKKCYLREDCPKYTVAQISSGSQVSALRCLKCN